MADGDCFTCTNTADPGAPRRERIVRTESWRVAHAFNTSLPGWLVLVPAEHIVSLDQLSRQAADELGPILRDLTEALVQVTGCEKTYVVLLAEAEGFSHLHFHVVPRAPNLAPDLRGPGIFKLLGVDESRRVADEDQDVIASRLITALSGTT